MFEGPAAHTVRMTIEPAADATSNFASTGLPNELVERLAARGISIPTPVQLAVIPLALAGGDILAQARTGSGKTLAFLLPLAARIQAGELKRAWVVCPTRELAQQCAREARTLLGEQGCAVCVGGVPAFQQVRELRANPPIVVGTPGRLCDHLHHGHLKPDAEILVLDEADQMLDLGFKDELDTLVKDLGTDVGRWLFSATFPPHVQEVVSRWLEQPKIVRLDTQQGASHVPQKVVVVRKGQELAALSRLIQALEPGRALTFVRTREQVEEVVQALAREGVEAAGISGDLTQDARERVLGRFRDGKLAVLVGTDVAARGIDVPGVTHVFNLGLPPSAESYTHRVGRTARAGAAGEAWTVVCQLDRSRFLRQASTARCRPEEVPLPTGAAIVDARRVRLARRVEETLGEGLGLPPSFRALMDAHGAEAVLAALVHRLVPDAPPERPVVPPQQMMRATPGGTGGSSEGVSLYIGVGLMDGITPASLIAMLCRSTGITGHQIGRLRVFDRHTIVAVADSAAPVILGQALHHRGRAVPVRLDEPIGAPSRERPRVGGQVRANRPPYRPSK